MSWQNRDEEDTTIYKVVVNHEEQYSIWPADRENALGWNDAGKVGPKAECLAYIKEVWTDMRPLSLRKKMEEMARNPPPPPQPSPEPESRESLVEKLSKGEHRVVASVGPETSVSRFKEALDRGYVHVKFTDTEGGTELGVRLDREGCDFSKANFEQATGSVHIEGSLRLDYENVKCISDIELETLAGKGHLEKVEAEGQSA
jgi:uncharacterized protein YbdZ (MbtH family)